MFQNRSIGKINKYARLSLYSNYNAYFQLRLSPGKKDLIMKLIEVGWLYSKVKRFCETHAKDPSKFDHQYHGSGLVNQSLVLALKEQLNEFCRLIAVLESQVRFLFN